MKLAAALTLFSAFFFGVSVGAYAQHYYRVNYLTPPRVDREKLRVLAV